MEMIDKLRELNKKLDDPYFVKEFEEGFEKFLKERDMKIYHTATLEDYDELMIELEEKGCKWLGGVKPTRFDGFKNYGKDTYIYDESGVLSFSSGYYFKAYCSNKTLIEYKAKGANKVEKKCEKCDVEYHDNAKYCSMCGKKLVSKPEFNVGDYVVDDSSYLMMKVDGISNSVVDSAVCYNFRYFRARINFVCETGYLRHATSEEVKEYESALNFYKHGRDPFEVKEGDILLKDSDYKFFVDNPEIWGKEDFVSGGYTFAKTVEEVNEWIKGE